jgi:hypothetical protein
MTRYLISVDEESSRMLWCNGIELVGEVGGSGLVEDAHPPSLPGWWKGRRARVRRVGVLSVVGVRRRALERLRAPRCATPRLRIGVIGAAGGLGGGETGHLLLGRGLLWLGGGDQRHRLDGEVAALDEPFVVLF